MSYCTQQDMIDRFGEQEIIQLTDHDNVGEINATVLDRAIADAAGEIDSRLSGRYATPITPVPRKLQRLACEFARYFLYDDAALDDTHPVRRQYLDGTLFLNGVASGKFGIGVDAAGDAPTSDNSASMQTGGHVFGRDDTGFI